MKREIICATCAPETGKILAVANAAGEFFRTQVGLARTDFRCDWCNAEIAERERCHAVSTARSFADYDPWESDYLDSV